MGPTNSLHASKQYYEYNERFDWHKTQHVIITPIEWLVGYTILL